MNMPSLVHKNRMHCFLVVKTWVLVMDEIMRMRVQGSPKALRAASSRARTTSFHMKYDRRQIGVQTPGDSLLL